MAVMGSASFENTCGLRSKPMCAQRIMEEDGQI